MTANRWDPFTDLVSLREAMNRLFEESVVRPGAFTGASASAGVGAAPGQPAARPVPVDVWQTADEVVVRATMPGVRPENVEISVVGDLLTLRGEQEREQEEAGRAWVRRERAHASFYREVPLPTLVQADRATATFEHGVLTIRLPKVEQVKPRTIKVQATSSGQGSTGSAPQS